MPKWEDERPTFPDQPPKSSGDRQETNDPDPQARLAAKAHFRLAPPYCVTFEDDGSVSLRRKRYEYWGKPDPAAATKWVIISSHPDLEDAERRLRHITSPTVYYDSRGRLAHSPAFPEEDWGVPDDDE